MNTNQTGNETAPAKLGAWTAQEDRLIVADYFAALDKLAKGEPVNKSATRRALAAQLPGRNEGSLEFKRCNVSAVLAELGRAWWPGYRPCYNYAKGLKVAVEAEVAARTVAA